MTLLARINIALSIVFILGVTVAGFISHSILQENAKREVMAIARLMIESALAAREYTETEIAPLLAAQLKTTFLPQSVPFYAATQNLDRLRKKRPEYTYKEATLNPTNPRDRATDWEADLIQDFRNNKGHEEIGGERLTANGPSMYLARPIRVRGNECLVCHSTAAVAPDTMKARYGTANGFGWQLNEIVGAQIVSVPLSTALEKADYTFRVFLGTLIGIFVVMFAVVNVLIRVIVLRPVALMASIADQVSKGDMKAARFESDGKDEISQLGQSFERMRRSLEKSMALLDR